MSWSVNYKLLERILKEQCTITDNKDSPVELKRLEEIVSDSLQIPSALMHPVMVTRGKVIRFKSWKHSAMMNRKSTSILT